jgi:hypothetical protein
MAPPLLNSLKVLDFEGFFMELSSSDEIPPVVQPAAFGIEVNLCMVDGTDGNSVRLFCI